MGWGGLQNGQLLMQAASKGFDVMITTDQGIVHQQNPSTLPISIVVLHAKSNKIDEIRPLVGTLLAALVSMKSRTLLNIR
jgi:hypothetical protein